MSSYQLATRFGRNSNVIRANAPLTDDQIRFVAPSVYAHEQHSSRSERYSYIPTNTILDSLREQGFQPFMACQSRTRNCNGSRLKSVGLAFNAILGSN